MSHPARNMSNNLLVCLGLFMYHLPYKTTCFACSGNLYMPSGGLDLRNVIKE